MLRRWGVLASAAVGVSLLVPAPSHASTTLGQLTPASLPNGCSDGSYIVQTGIAGGLDYRVPAGGGVITGWKGRTFSTAGPDQILQLAVIGENVSGDAVTFEALSDFEHLVPVAPSGRTYSFATRISVDGGERIGLYAKDTSGPEAFTWACAVQTGSGNADRDIWGALSAPVIGGPPAPATFGQFLSQRVPVEATLEADADKDGFGDETQDLCPTSAATQSACPVPPVTFPAPPAVTNPAPAPVVVERCVVPNLVGKHLKAAKKMIRAAHCKVGNVIKEEGVSAKSGTVVKQNPKAGKVRAAASMVNFTLGI